MTDYPLVRFVDSPDKTAAVRFDFHRNDGEGGTRAWSDRAEWSWQPGTLLGEPDGTGSDYSLGRLDLTLYISGSRADALRTMSALARELQRNENYMLFQLSQESAPMWLKVYRPSAGALTFPYIDPDSESREDVWVLPVSLPTESFALGEQVAETVTISNDPADVNGLAVVLSDVKGDATAPLIVEVPLSASDAIAPLLSVAALDDVTSPGLTFWQAESLTLGAATAVAASGSTSGGSVARVTLPADAANAVRITGSVAPDLAGTYRLFARVTAVFSGAGVVTLTPGGAAQVTAADPTELELSVVPDRLIELGTYAWPRFNPPLRRPYTIGPSGGDFTISASSTVSSTQAVDVDYIVAVPVDLPLDARRLRTLSLDAVSAGSAALVLSIDGELERCHARAASDGLLTSMTVDQGTGAFPALVPGADNLLHFLPRRTGIGGEQVTTSTTLTLTYRPLYTYLPDS